MSFKSINEWYQYDSSEFKVLFPKMPSSTIKKINTEAGELEPRLGNYKRVFFYVMKRRRSCLALMGAASCGSGVQSHRYSGQQDES